MPLLHSGFAEPGEFTRLRDRRKKISNARRSARVCPKSARAVTAWTMSHHRPKALAAGFDGYQAKPINVKEFLQVVREMLDRRAGPGGGA